MRVYRYGHARKAWICRVHCSIRDRVLVALLALDLAGNVLELVQVDQCLLNDTESLVKFLFGDNKGWSETNTIKFGEGFSDKP